MIENLTNSSATIIISLYIIINLIKTLTVGRTFSVVSLLIHGEDYKKWYNFKQKYIPPHKRQNFKSKKQ